MTTQTRELLYFDEIKESRGTYYVEYQPPHGAPFALMSLVYPGSYEISRVVEDMHAEIKRWLARYPVPLMVSVWDVAENSIYPTGNYEEGFLYAWFAPGTQEIVTTWKQEELPAFFNDTTNLSDWRAIYKDVPFRTDAEVKANAKKKLGITRKQVLIWKAILTFWVAVIPATWAIIEYLGPEWLATAVLGYSLWQAWRAWRKLMGYSKPSAVEEEKAEKQRKMEHYFWHCERNPEGFARLAVENFERQFAERTRKEAEDLAKAEARKSSG